MQLKGASPGSVMASHRHAIFYTESGFFARHAPSIDEPGQQRQQQNRAGQGKHGQIGRQRHQRP